MKTIKIALKHKFSLLLVLAQLAVLMLLMVKLPVRRCVSEFNYNYDNSSENNNVKCLDGTAVLRSGAYEVTVDYELQDGSDASLTVTSEKKPDTVINNIVKLTNGKGRASSRIWLPLGGGADDLKMNLSSENTCTVTHIRFREILKYRILRAAGYLLLFAITDSFIFLFLSKKISARTKYIVLGICAISLLAALPSLTNNTFKQHDYLFHINRILSIADALSSGYFPVRIHFRLLHGYGFANSIFYGDILLYFPAVLYNMGMSVQMAYKAYLIAVHIGTAYIAWWCFNKMTDDYKVALFGSLIYTLSAYRITNIFIRGALGEYTAMMFLPLICYGFMHIYGMPDSEKGTWKDSFPLCMGLTGCLQSHLLTVEMSAVFIVLFCILKLKKTFAKNRFILLSKTLAATVLVNLWFIVPLLDYSRYPFKIMDYRPEIYKDGLSFYEILSVFFRDNGMRIFIGAPFIVATGWYLFLVIKQGKEFKLAEKANWFLGFGWLAVFMTTYYFPWKLLRSISMTVYTFFSSVQFTWRYFSVATVLLAFLAVLTANYLRINGKGKSCTAFMLTLSLLGVIPVLMFYQDYATNFQRLTFYSEQDISSDHIMDDFYLPSETDRELLTITKPTSTDAELTVLNYTQENHRFEIDCNNSSGESKILEMPLINYKGYAAYDKKTNKSLEIVNSSNNTLNVKIPKGYSGTVKVEFREPYYWRLSEVISLLAIVFYLFLCFKRKKTQRQE